MVFVPTSLYDSPDGYFALRFLASFFVYSISCSQVLLFHVDAAGATSSKTGTHASHDDNDKNDDICLDRKAGPSERDSSGESTSSSR